MSNALLVKERAHLQDAQQAIACMHTALHMIDQGRWLEQSSERIRHAEGILRVAEGFRQLDDAIDTLRRSTERAGRIQNLAIKASRNNLTLVPQP